MKILLIAPARKPEWGESFWDLKAFAKLTGKKAGGALLALPTLAALTPVNIEVLIIDENIEDIDFSQKADLVGISFLTSLAPRAYEIADLFRSKGVKVVLGGIHASMLPEEAIQHADSVVIGEAEEVWPKLIADFETGSLAKFYRAECFPDLESSPIPRWDLLRIDCYCYFTIQVGRGCPNNCDFCSVHVFNGRRYRHKSIKRVKEELEFLKSLHPKKTVFFADDNLLAKPGYAKELMETIVPLDLRFWAQASLNNLDDEELLTKMYEAGCRVIFIGLESVSQDSLSTVHKSEINKVAKYEEIIDKIHSSGIGVFGSFVLGMETDDEQIFEKTADFIEAAGIPFAAINVLTPLVGTRLFDRYEKEGRILSKTWEDYTVERVCIRPNLISIDELARGRQQLLRELNSYKSLYARLRRSWKKGAFVRGNRSLLELFTKGRVLITMKNIANKSLKRTFFILRSLWNSDVTSITSVLLALNFHDYAYLCNKSRSRRLGNNDKGS